MPSEGKRIRMRIYKVHDYDLLIYYESLRDKSLGNPKVSFSAMMRDLLSDYCRVFIKGESDISFKGPPEIKNLYSGKLRSSIYVRFTVNDSEVIKMLNSIQPRQVNSFLKNLLRRYMTLTIFSMDCYFNGNIKAKPVVGTSVNIFRDVKYKPSGTRKKKTNELKTEDTAQIMPVDSYKATSADMIEETPAAPESEFDSDTVLIKDEFEMAEIKDLDENNKKEKDQQEFDLFSALGSIMS